MSLPQCTMNLSQSVKANYPHMVLVELMGIRNQKMAVSGKMHIEGLSNNIRKGEKSSLYFFVGKQKKMTLVNPAVDLHELSQKFKGEDGYLRLHVQKTQTF